MACIFIAVTAAEAAAAAIAACREAIWWERCGITGDMAGGNITPGGACTGTGVTWCTGTPGTPRTREVPCSALVPAVDDTTTGVDPRNAVAMVSVAVVTLL